MTTSLESDDAVGRAAERLRAATAGRTPCAPVRDLIGEADLDAAYAVQQHNVAALVAGGRTIVGRKIGLTSPAVQAQLGVDRPDFGVLLDDMDVTGHDEVPTERLLQPKIEAEVAFTLGADLVEGDLDRAQVLAAIDGVRAALEIVDSRIAGWDIRFGDTVADNASSGLFVLADDVVSPDDVAPVDVVMSMTRNGEEVSTGTGAACLGDPVEALVWLARTARSYGQPLRAGQLVLSGALGPMVDVHPGDVVEATLTGLGTVRAVFSTPSDSHSTTDQEQ